uniref:Uncharacterized protein n=1 Tax=Amphimedon queenslandica TaxID=400682 RepID=A0A1X7TD02_AMPQE
MNLGSGIFLGLGIAGLAIGTVLKLQERMKKEVLVRELPPTVPHYYDDYEDLRNNLSATSTGNLQDVLIQGKVIASPDFSATNEVEAAIHKLGPVGKLRDAGKATIEGSATCSIDVGSDSTPQTAGWRKFWKEETKNPQKIFSVPFQIRDSGRKYVTIKDIQESENWTKVLEQEQSLGPMKKKFKDVKQTVYQTGIKYDILLYGSTIAVLGIRKPVLCLVYTATNTIMNPMNNDNIVEWRNPDLWTSHNPIRLKKGCNVAILSFN